VVTISHPVANPRLRRKAKRLVQVVSDFKAMFPETWRLYLRGPNDERALLDGCWVDEALGQRVVDFFPKFLRHPVGRWAGQPFVLEPWQANDIIMPAFSWIRSNGLRRFRTIQIWVAKKNGKSAIASGLTIYSLLGDDEESARVNCLANDREQAGIVYGAAADMVDASYELRSRLSVVRSKKMIKASEKSWIRALSADVAKHEGLDASALIVDELHSFDARGAERFETLRYSGAIREQPLTIVTSTAGEDEGGIGRSEYEHGKAVMAGDIEDITTYAYIAEAEEDDDDADPKTWAKANPNLGVTINETELRESYGAALGNPTRLSKFRRYRLNKWVAAKTPWLDMVKWSACEDCFDVDELAGRPCCAALDLGDKWDLSALALCWLPTDDDPCHRFKVWFWTPDGIADEKTRKERLPYRDYADRGFITLTPGDSVERSWIKQEIVELHKRFGFALAFDPWKTKEMCQSLQDDHGMNVMEFAQAGWHTYAEPTQQLEDIIDGGTLRHDGNPILRSHAAQCVVATDRNGNKRPVKSTKNRKYHIDGIVAMIMALGLSNENIMAVSSYETEGLDFV